MSEKKPPLHPLHRNAGFSLIEVMFALGMFGLLSLSMASALVFYARINTDNEYRSGAIQVAQAVLDELRSSDPASLPSVSGTTETRSITAEGKRRPYTVVITYCANATWCNTSDKRHIKVAVTYAGKLRYETETVYSQLR